MHLSIPGNLYRLLGLVVMMAGAALSAYVQPAPGPAAPAAPAPAGLTAGCQELAKRNFPRSVELLKTACAEDPRWLLPREYLAMAYQAGGQTREARAGRCGLPSCSP